MNIDVGDRVDLGEDGIYDVLSVHQDRTLTVMDDIGCVTRVHQDEVSDVYVRGPFEDIEAETRRLDRQHDGFRSVLLLFGEDMRPEWAYQQSRRQQKTKGGNPPLLSLRTPPGAS